LKNEKANLGCHGKGPGEAWDCKREMVNNCLDQNADFEQYDSAAIADFVAKFRESEIIAENTKDYLKRKTEQELLMQNDFKEEPKVVTLGDKFDKNNKGKVKVGFVRRQQKESKNNIDTTDVALEHQAAALAYINQSNDEPAAAEPATEPADDATAESDFSFEFFEDEPEDAPMGEFNSN
jgi:hypothetical protein